MAETKTTAARAPLDKLDSQDSAVWVSYGSGDETISDDGGYSSPLGMTIDLNRRVYSNFKFHLAGIPTRAKIAGINVSVEGNGESAVAGERDLRAHLCLGRQTYPAFGATLLPGLRVGNRAAWTMNATTDTVHAATTDGTSNLGDPLWGRVWDLSEVMDTTFGVVLSRDSATPQGASQRRFIDLITISIAYTDPDTGFRWWPVLRCVPDNGAEETIDLRAVLTDLGGPMKTDAKYSALQERRETINRRIVPAPFGFRAEIILTLDILTMADAANWTKIVNRCMSPDWTVYLSMDGGVTERQVFLSRMDGPDPLGGKTHVGGRFLLGLTTAEVFPEMPNFGGIGFGLGNW